MNSKNPKTIMNYSTKTFEMGENLLESKMNNLSTLKNAEMEKLNEDKEVILSKKIRRKIILSTLSFCCRKTIRWRR